ncbi:MAG: hotdog domain-containing protein [Acidimicrobiia bacterium]
MSLRPGLVAAVELVVAESDTALALHTGDVPVLATPRVVTLAEEASVLAIEGELGEGSTSVGYRVQLDHLAPTAVGGKVRAEATLESIEGRRLTFRVSVNDGHGLVAAGRITRVIVERTRFMEKAAGD